MFSSFGWYRKLRGGKWAQATGWLGGKRWVKLASEAQDAADENWESATTDIAVPVEDYIPVAARLPSDSNFHPVKIRIKRSGAICFATARFRRGRWEGYVHASPDERFKVMAWRDMPGVITNGQTL